MGNRQWRTIDRDSFEKTEVYLRDTIKSNSGKVKLNLCLVGHTAAGKSSFINSIFSISRGRITHISSVKTEDIDGVGTKKFLRFQDKEDDLFPHMNVYDTMGFTQTNSDDGIKDEDLKSVLEGKIPTYHEFNSSERTGDQNKEEMKPHCVIIVVSAEVVQNMQIHDDSVLTRKMRNLHSFLPSDVTRIVVITKCDRISDLVHKSITNIYTCQTIYSVVQKATKIFGTPEYMVFPIVNYYKELRLDREKNVPILYALMFALNFAADRQEFRP